MPEALELLDLLRHTLLERLVELVQLHCLGLDRVVVALDAKERPDAHEELVVVERLRNEVVGTGLDRSLLLGADARRDHDHREHRGLLIRAQPAADGVSVEVRHHDVEEDEIRFLGLGCFERGSPIRSGDDVVAACAEHRLQQAHVLRDVVDDEDSRLVLTHRRLLRSAPSPS